MICHSDVAVYQRVADSVWFTDFRWKSVVLLNDVLYICTEREGDRLGGVKQRSFKTDRDHFAWCWADVLPLNSWFVSSALKADRCWFLMPGNA